MEIDRFTVRFWGVRGSVAAGGSEFAGVGGNTSCVEVRAGDELIILDAGTGAVPLGRTLRNRVRATFLISHFHWDHIQGFPFFSPAYERGNTFMVYGPGEGVAGVEAALRRQMQPPHFPVPLAEMAAHVEFRSLRPGDEIEIGPARVGTAWLDHPQGCLGYRITAGGRSLVYATDTEHPSSGVVDPGLLEFARGVDLLIADAQYTDDEYRGRCGPPRRSWGHSTVSEACRLARAAGVRRLALFHHDPGHDDRFVAGLEREARALFPSVVAAREGLAVDLLAADRVRAVVRAGRAPERPLASVDLPVHPA